MNAPKLLIVDDDANIRTSVRLCLEAEGYEVLQATNGAEALEIIHHDSPDLVLVDLAMPVMDGMTLLAEIRSLLPEKRIRVVVMTAHGSVKIALSAVRLGASDFLQKPLTPDEVRQSVTSVLNDAPPAIQAPEGTYGQVLQEVRRSLRAGEFATAEAALMKAGTITDDDPAFLNLAGILHESHGRVKSARHFYEKAAALDRSYRPAQENLKRLGELRRRGHTQRKVAFGDGDITEGAEDASSAVDQERGGSW
jgi:DNA-binding response OmpR family regulator